jgi:hypothetical protein
MLNHCMTNEASIAVTMALLMSLLSVCPQEANNGLLLRQLDGATMIAMMTTTTTLQFPVFCSVLFWRLPGRPEKK